MIWGAEMLEILPFPDMVVVIVTGVASRHLGRHDLNVEGEAAYGPREIGRSTFRRQGQNLDLYRLGSDLDRLHLCPAEEKVKRVPAVVLLHHKL